MTYIKYSINASQGRSYYLIDSSSLGLSNWILKYSGSIKSETCLRNSLTERKVPSLQRSHKEIPSLSGLDIKGWREERAVNIIPNMYLSAWVSLQGSGTVCQLRSLEPRLWGETEQGLILAPLLIWPLDQRQDT